MSVILTNSLRKPISCCVYVTGSTNLTTRVKSVCEKRLWGVVAIKKCVNCQFELQKWKVVPWSRKNVNRPVSDSAEVDCASNNVSSGVANTSTVDPAPVAEDFNQEIAAKLDFKENFTRVCRLQTARNNVPYRTEEYYRRAVYAPYLDDFCNSLKERFESHKETVASLKHIIPEFCTKTDFYSLEAAFNFYEEDLSHKEVVQSEFMMWKEKWSQKKYENLPKTAISSLEKCDKIFFPNIYILVRLLAVLPVSVAIVERSFLSLRRLKTYLRNPTSEISLMD
ncbi:hypothetical protein AVEN_271179-1 [Araneus ventricosus]|uniref:HAT C-terminal dimerisation domain-containing protein n=1 Tax=Araneus ventricosus TaxID=182803 RepID=A0A4Y2P9M4_ARAVE|nr:hypothetical protein AVEN_271179-1 [Araneus ventricosus]